MTAIGKAVVTVAGREIDLVPLVGILDDLDTDARAQWVPAAGRTDLMLGELAYVPGFGQSRRGVIVNVGKSRITVAFTTPGSVATAVRNGWAVPVYKSPKDSRQVHVNRPVNS